MRRQPWPGGNYLQNMYLTKDMYLKYVQNLYNSIIRIQSNQKKKHRKDDI